VAAQAKAGDQKGYVSGDGAVEKIPAAKRGAPVKLKGALLDGSGWDIASTRGKVLVRNVWRSWCAPCVAEARRSSRRGLTCRRTGCRFASWASTSERIPLVVRHLRRR
jgi:hypothetical protein